MPAMISTCAAVSRENTALCTRSRRSAVSADPSGASADAGGQITSVNSSAASCGCERREALGDGRPVAGVHHADQPQRRERGRRAREQAGRPPRSARVGGRAALVSQSHAAQQRERGRQAPQLRELAARGLLPEARRQHGRGDLLAEAVAPRAADEARRGGVRGRKIGAHALQVPKGAQGRVVRRPVGAGR